MESFFHANFWEMILRTTLSFFALLILARILGKKQLGQLTFFHYITGITFGSIASEIASQHETPFLDGLISLIWWSVLTYLMTIMTIKSARARVIIDDKPTIVINNGLILESALKKSRLHMDELTMLLREQSVFSIQDVQYALFETNGKLSVLPKPSEQAATKQDVKADITPPTYMPTEVVSDGQLIYENLVELELTEDWLTKKLKKQNVNSVEDVFFAQVQANGSLYISLKDKARRSSP
ncbi:YetF domain-containing protein [Lysinibacillus sp. NPDC048646]|uniref:YetF domain-containing protein n=1 Tax=Lysinibacillus sp. NPDC048646 TaxID=3390574 RepID=UPI00117DF853|nr:DUF421 domain-containing protein [Lysinibacillus fusiformis]